jgi:hypothetical protein
MIVLQYIGLTPFICLLAMDARLGFIPFEEFPLVKGHRLIITTHKNYTEIMERVAIWISALRVVCTAPAWY